MPARAKPTDSSPVPLAAKVEMDLTLQALADVLGMNVYRFIHAFKQSTGVPPHRYVMHPFRRLTNITPGRYRQGLIAGAGTPPTGSSF